jgi:hypothetical protein
MAYELTEVAAEKPALIIILILVVVIVAVVIYDLFTGYGIFRRLIAGIIWFLPFGSVSEPLLGAGTIPV